MIVTPILLLTFGYVALRVGAAYASVKPHFNWHTTKYVYAFGDSYTFVQGTKGHANFSFIGDALQPSFSPHDLLSDEIIPRNTSSDGSNWIEFLTGCFEGLPSECSPHQLWNFAFAGADIDAKILPRHHDFTLSLVDEVTQWVSYASHVIPHPPEETITFWWIGINDTGDTVGNSTITDFEAFWNKEMTSFFMAVEFAVTRGLGGTHFFINVPPEHRSPNFLSSSNAARASKLKANIELYNSILNQYVLAFQDRHKNINVLSFDAYKWFGEILDNADRFGFKNTTGFCECDDDTFFWFNSGHPTEHVHRLLAGAIEEELLKASR
ncbi:hypothetical protein K474DRAFT_1608680 [Panus rudis PR-1116 ss-1]|nr:hypothetical protein K474DRAFT_1608680 [Panus rudis PR-1116 ss-1]